MKEEVVSKDPTPHLSFLLTPLLREKTNRCSLWVWGIRKHGRWELGHINSCLLSLTVASHTYTLRVSLFQKAPSYFLPVGVFSHGDGHCPWQSLALLALNLLVSPPWVSLFFDLSFPCTCSYQRDTELVWWHIRAHLMMPSEGTSLRAT